MTVLRSSIWGSLQKDCSNALRDFPKLDAFTANDEHGDDRIVSAVRHMRVSMGLQVVSTC